MKHNQKRISAQTTFAFGETELRYSFRHGSSAYEVVADYFEILPARQFVARRDWSRLRLSLVLTILGLAAMSVQASFAGAQVASLLWLTPGLLPLALFVFHKAHFRVFQAGGEPVWIIEDKNSHTIIAEIELRRRNRLSQIYGELNLANEPQLEIRKIEWLVLESVLTRDEADRQIATLGAAAADKAAAVDVAAGVQSMFAREALAI